MMDIVFGTFIVVTWIFLITATGISYYKWKKSKKN